MKNRQRILIYSTAYYPFVGGAEVSIKEITDRLGDKYDFDLITAKLDTHLPDIEKVGAVTVYRVGFGYRTLDKLLLPFWGAVLSARLQKEKTYICMWGVMVTYASGAGYISNIWRALTRQSHVPMVLTLQEGDSETYLQYKWAGLIYLSWKLALARTDIVTSLSTFLLNRARSFGFEGVGYVVPNGVDLKYFATPQKPADVARLKEKLGKKDCDVYLITTSRLVKKNAVDDCIRALALLPAHVYLIIIGQGEDEYMLRALALECGVRERVTFMGFIPQHDIPLFLAVSDVFVRPSRSEGFGNSFIEAMASGLPVVATPVGGIPDFIDDRQTGLFCRPDNPKSLAQSIMELMNNPSLCDTVARQGKQRVIEKYSWDLVVAEMKDKVFSSFR